jgi:hypothetical protein
MNVAQANELEFKSDYVISQSQVDEYKYEAVKQRSTQKRKRKNAEVEAEQSDEEEIEDEVVQQLGAESIEVAADGTEWHVKNIQAEPGMELNAEVTDCVERWKANADDSKKGMFECFDEAGTFVAICRHGFVVSVCDIVQSGEL